MSEVFGDDFPDVFSTVLNDAEVAARRQVESATGQLVAMLRNRTVAEHERAVRAEREVARLDAHLQTCEAARTNAEVRLAELEVAVTRPAPAPAFRHLYRQDQTGVGTECGRPWTTKEHELATGPALPVCWECVRAVLDKQEERNMTLRRERGQLQDQLRDRVRQLDQAEAKANAIAAEARGDRQARDQLVQAVRVAIREAVPDA